MAITITLGTITVDQRTLDKRQNFTDSEPADISAKLKDNCSVMQPIFLLTASVVDIVNYNYCYVSDWGRYYFIRNVITMPGGRIELRCAEDVLTSNADAKHFSENPFILGDGAFFDQIHYILSVVGGNGSTI